MPTLMQPLGAITTDALCQAWASRWYALVCEASQYGSAVPDRYTEVAQILLAPGDASTILSHTQLIDEALTPEHTGLPTTVTQFLGARALTETLFARYPVTEDTFNLLQDIAIPWLHHPYFSLNTVSAITAADNVGELLQSLVSMLHLCAPNGEVHLWRITDSEGPFIDIASSELPLSVTQEDRPDLQYVLDTNEPEVREQRILAPLHTGYTPFAVIEATVNREQLEMVSLHILSLMRLANEVLSRISGQEQANTATTWQRVLTRLAQALSVRSTPEAVLTAMAEQVRQALPCERIACWYYQQDSDEFELRTLSARVTREYVTVGTRCPAADTPLQVVRHTGKPLLLQTNWAHRFPNYPNARDSVATLAVIPIVVEYRTLCIITLERLEARPFTKADAGWLMLVGSMVGSALDNIQIHQELQQAQERALEDTKMRALGEMAAGIAHDFNNLLTGIMCNVELLQLTTDLQKVKDRLPRLERAITDAREIIQRISTFGRRDGSRFTPVRLDEVLRESIELLQPQLNAHAVQLEETYTPEVWVQGAPAELREVVTNLVANALHALPAGGAIRLACGQRADTAWFSVADTGVGMPAEVLKRACEPFFSTKGGTGTGLGLSVSYQIIHRHNGHLHLASEEGKGTVARIELPLYQAPAETAAPATPPNRRILLVEDVAEVAEMLALLLNSLGYQTTLAHGIADGLQQCRQQHFDLVITDFQLGNGETGDSIAGALRQAHPDTPVVLMSGSLGVNDACTELYAEIWQKPLSLAALREGITRVLGNENTSTMSVH